MGTRTSPKHRRKKSLLLTVTISVFLCFFFFSVNIKTRELIKLLSLSLCIYLFFLNSKTTAKRAADKCTEPKEPLLLLWGFAAA